jgi:hypothetical protein
MKRDPVLWILLLAGVLRAIGLTWGLPASDGWDDDGVAPRDFLVGLVETFTPGHHYTYPPLHLLILALATLPIWLFKLVTAPALSPDALVPHFTTTATMTAFAVIARCISLAMSLGTIRVVSLFAKEMTEPSEGGESARVAEIATALILTVNLSLCYYGHTTNLDGPYLFWGALSVLYWARALNHDAAAPALERRSNFVRAGVFAAFAVATKDQAYALFVLAFPISLGLSALLERKLPKPVHLAVALGVFMLVLLVVDGPLYNPSGLRARLAFLTGPASQNHAYYPKTWAGRMRVLHDLGAWSERFYPPVAFAPLVLAGLWRSRTTRRVLPVLVALSFTLAFNLVARRTENRFALPQSIFLAPTAGLGVAWLWSSMPRIRRPLSFAFVLFGLHALYLCVALDVTLLKDPRYAVEAWLKANTKPGDTVEVYGNNVYLPRIPAHLRATRILGLGETPRNPIPGMLDVEAAFEDQDARKADYIVIPAFWSQRYMREVTSLPEGYMLQPIFLEQAQDLESRRYFHTLIAGERNYERVFTGKFESSLFPAIDIHASTAQEVWIYRRKFKQ